MPPFPPSSYPRAPLDTPMSDAPFRTAPSGAQSSRSLQHHGSSHSGDGTPRLPDGSQPQHSQQQSSSSSTTPQAPRSPQLRGHNSTQQTPTPNTIRYSQSSMPRQQPSAQPSPAQSARSHSTAASAQSPQRIKVRSLTHIKTFATDESSPFSPARRRADGDDVGPQYEISEMPVSDIIEMVAGLLTKITTTNDRQHEHLHRQIPPPDGTTGLSPQTSSVLAFHGKNIPSITILSYLSRIHKYCPTTYEVFLSLLVYFDRMTERVNSGPMQSLRQANQQSLERAAGGQHRSRPTSITSAAPPAQGSPAVAIQAQAHTQTSTPPPSGSLGMPAPSGVPGDNHRPPSPPVPIDSPLESDPYHLSHFFVVDSFNIHRLVIAGVTCASKFFSDIFYTNSRYAKVRGNDVMRTGKNNILTPVCRLEDYLCQSLTTWSFSSCFSMISD